MNKKISIPKKTQASILKNMLKISTNRFGRVKSRTVWGWRFL